MDSILPAICSGLMTVACLTTVSLGQNKEASSSASPPATSFQEDQNDKPVTENKRARKVASFGDLTDVFRSAGFRFQSNEQRQSIRFATKRDNFSGVMIVKWDSRAGVIHFIQTLPLTVDKNQTSRFLDVASRLNHGFLFPGIGLDHETNGTYYRMSVPVNPRNYLWDFEVVTYTRFTLNQAVEYSPTLSILMKDDSEPEDAIKIHLQQKQKLMEDRVAAAKLVGEYQATAIQSDWLMKIEAGNTLRLFRDGKLSVISKIQVQGDRITFVDRDGDLASDNPGVYTFQLKSGKLQFTPIKDQSEGRKTVLVAGDWTRTK